jgi:hypothetical protein
MASFKRVLGFFPWYKIQMVIDCCSDYLTMMFQLQEVTQPRMRRADEREWRIDADLQEFFEGAVLKFACIEDLSEKRQSERKQPRHGGLQSSWTRFSYI